MNNSRESDTSDRTLYDKHRNTRLIRHRAIKARILRQSSHHLRTQPQKLPQSDNVHLVTVKRRAHLEKKHAHVIAELQRKYREKILRSSENSEDSELVEYTIYDEEGNRYRSIRRSARLNKNSKLYEKHNMQTTNNRTLQSWIDWRLRLNSKLIDSVLDEGAEDRSTFSKASVFSCNEERQNVGNVLGPHAVHNILNQLYDRGEPCTSLDSRSFLVYGIPRLKNGNSSSARVDRQRSTLAEATKEQLLCDGDGEDNYKKWEDAYQHYRSDEKLCAYQERPRDDFKLDNHSKSRKDSVNQVTEAFRFMDDLNYVPMTRGDCNTGAYEDEGYCGIDQLHQCDPPGQRYRSPQKDIHSPRARLVQHVTPMSNKSSRQTDYPGTDQITELQQALQKRLILTTQAEMHELKQATSAGIYESPRRRDASNMYGEQNSDHLYTMTGMMRATSPLPLDRSTSRDTDNSFAGETRNGGLKHSEYGNSQALQDELTNKLRQRNQRMKQRIQ